MQKTIILICLLVLFCSPAMAQNKNNYLGFTIGAVFPRNLESKNKLIGRAKLYDVDLSTGGMFGFKIGHIFSKSRIIAIEFEGLAIQGTDANNEFYYFYPDAPNPPVNVDADISIEALMLNVLIRAPSGKIHPYAGLGIGWTRFHIDNITTILPPGYFWTETGTQYYHHGNVDDNTFGYQFLTGIGIEVTENVSFNIDIRFLQAEPDIKRGSDFDIDATYKTCIINTGLNFMF